MAAATQRLGTSRSEGNLSVSSRLTDQRRERLMNLKKREDLKGALTEKFKGRFGHGGSGRNFDEMSVASQTIRQEVDKFAQTADVTENNLHRLERRLHSKAKKKDEDTGASVISAYSNASRRSRSVASLTGESVIKSGPIHPEVCDWAKLDEYASYLHEQDAVRQKMGVQALQRKLRMDLDHQVSEKQRRKDEDTQEEQRYHQNSMIELERWKQTEQMRAEELRQKLVREKRDRDDQLNFERQMKAEEMNRKKEEEGALVEKIVNEMEAEQRRFEKKKAQTKASMRRVFEENMDDQRRKQEQLRLQREQEAQAMEEYNRILDEQEENRAEELAARLDRQKQLMDKLQANVAAQAKNAGDADAQRANAQQEEIDRHYFEAEKKKQERLKQLRLENKAYLFKQMGEKDARKDEEKELSDIQARILQRDTEEYNTIEREKAFEKRSRNFEHRKDIEKQMLLRGRQQALEMSNHEVQMNKPLLELVHRTLQDRDQQYMDEAEEMQAY